MNANTNPGTDTWPEPADVIGAARALEHASRNLCRTTLTRPHLTPADVDAVLAHLAAAAAALPQAAPQLSEIFDEVRQVRGLAMDTLSETQDPDLAIDTARLHLDATREPAVSLHRHLDAAHQHTAHFSTSGKYMHTDAPGSTSSDRRPRTASHQHAHGPASADEVSLDDVEN